MAKKNSNTPSNSGVDSEEDDLGTPEMQAREGYDKNARRMVDNPLAYYHRRGDISGSQHYAGSRLYADHQSCNQHISVMTKLEELPGRDLLGSDSENPFAARERYHRAMKTLGPVHSKLALLVCIEGNMVASVRGNFRWSKRYTGMDHLCEALDILYDFYNEQDELKKNHAHVSSGTDTAYSLR